jgi:lycopene beta-cyclase
MPQLDYLLIGAGLQSALLSEALLRLAPGARVAIVERGSRLGGNHTWSFHSADVPEPARAFVEPFVAHRWARHRVEFANFERTLDEPYAALTSDSVQAVLEARARRGELELCLERTVVRVGPTRVELATGEVIEARRVIDSRGPEPAERLRALGYQKFVGLELEVRAGTAPREPVLMDARVDQNDGFRFFYVLPFSPERVLVEETYFSDTKALDLAACRAAIARYAAERGLEASRVLREESGVLPLPEAAPLRWREDGRIRGGYRGGWFHPTTGYSFPLAVRFALAVARQPADLEVELGALARETARQQRFAGLLNRLLFRGFAPADRHRVLERFYRLPAPTIRRFYALTTTPFDRAAILCGRPPRGFSAVRFWSRTGPVGASARLEGESA